MTDRAWGGRAHETSYRTPRQCKKCISRPRIFIPLVCLIVFLATNSTIGQLWRGFRGCAGQHWAQLGDHQYALGESIHTLQTLGFQPHQVLDIGANEGNWVTAMHAKLPGATFFCVEGNQALEHILKPRAAALGVPYRIAIVGDEEKDVTFNIMCDGGPCSGGSSVFQENTQYGAGERKETRHMTTIDALVRDAGVGPFQMIKLDIQGAPATAHRCCPLAAGGAAAIPSARHGERYERAQPSTMRVCASSVGCWLFQARRSSR